MNATALQLDFVPLPQAGMIEIVARSGDWVVHNDTVKIDEPRSRQRFAEAVCRQRPDIDYQTVKAELAGIAVDLANARHDPADTCPDLPSPAWVTVDELMHRETYTKGLPLVTSGFDTLDDALNGGLRGGSITILAGRTGSAKTQFAANIARRASLSGVNTLWLPLEDGVELAAWRLHAAASQVPLRLMLDGFAGRDGPGIKALRSTYRLLKDIPLKLSDVRKLSDVQMLVRQHAEEGGQLVILDQVSKVTVEAAGNTSSYERVSAISEQMRLAATTHRVALVLVSQVNREASKAERELQISDLRDSGMLEQDAAAVVLINGSEEVPHVSGQQQPGCRYLCLRIGKVRFGRFGQGLRMLWYPRVQRIEDAPNEPEGEPQ